MAKKRFHSGVLREDKSAIANLPRNDVYTSYPSCEYITSDLDDTMAEMDAVRNSDVLRTKRIPKSKTFKY